MKVVITEGQLKNLYEVKDRPFLTDVEYLVVMEADENNATETNPDQEFNLGMTGDTEGHRLYYFYIGEAFFDEFYDKAYLELFDEHKENKESCQNFVDAIIDSILGKMKESIASGGAQKILKKVIKTEKIVKFKESDIKKVLENHFGNIICHEFFEDIR